MKSKHFASDNYSGVHPRILQAIAEVSEGHVPAYGGDVYTQRAEESFKKIFGSDDVHFVFNGTAANVLSLGSALKPFEAVICSERAHIHEDEGGAPEKFLGTKLITLPSPNGKITVDQIAKASRRDFDQHRVQTRVVSLTQSTEYGTLYQPEEIHHIAEWCHAHDHILHVDGARLANAAVALGTDLKTACGDCDVLSFGATKNGLLLGEAVVFFNSTLSTHFKNHRKQAMQLMSKMRFVSVQFETYLNEELWKTNATHSNRMTKLLLEKLKQIPSIKITQKAEVNAIFARVPREAALVLQKKFNFYIWRELSPAEVEVRWMTSFDTTESDVQNFVDLLQSSLKSTTKV